MLISWEEIYTVLSHVTPLYAVMILAYSSVRWWKIFTPNECSGINRFVMLFCAPLFSIKYILNNDPYAVNYRVIAADTLQKVTITALLLSWCRLSSRGCSIEWFITLFSVSTLTNTLLFGIPLLRGMYGESLSESVMVQLSVYQCIVWYPSLLFLFEYRKARLLVPWTYTERETVATRHDDDDSNGGGGGGGDLGFDEERDIGVNDQEIIQDQRPNDNASNRGSSVSEMSSRSRVEVVKPETQIEPKLTDMLPSGVTTRVLFIMVWMKLMKNPNFYTSIIAVIWSLISFRWNVKLPTIVMNSITILSDAGLGMSMFSLGLFMAAQPRIIAGGAASAIVTTVIRFIVSPAIMAATALVVGFKGTMLQLTIVQGALPLAIVPFIYAREYNVHSDIVGTSVGFGMLISLPITLAYFILLKTIIK